LQNILFPCLLAQLRVEEIYKLPRISKGKREAIWHIQIMAKYQMVLFPNIAINIEILDMVMFPNLNSGVAVGGTFECGSGWGHV